VYTYIKNAGKVFLATILSFIIPLKWVFALTTPSKNLGELVNNFIINLTPVVIFIAGFGFFGLLTGILKYIGAGADEERLGKAKQLIVYGLLGMIIIFSFWGMARLLANNYLGVDTFK
jgi:hypothetical protein